MELQIGVKVLLRNNAGKYLLLRRSLQKYADVKGEWDIVGGRINPGMPLLSNLRREVKEETGLTLRKIEKILAAQDILRVKNKHTVRITYLGRADGKVSLDDENVEYRWLSLNELKRFPKRSLDMYFSKLLKDLKI